MWIRYTGLSIIIIIIFHLTAEETEVQVFW